MAAGTLPDQAVWKFSRDNGILEVQAMVAAGLSTHRALKAATSGAAELLGRDDLGVLEPGRCADIVAIPGNPLADITATARVDLVMKAGVIARRIDE